MANDTPFVKRVKKITHAWTATAVLTATGAGLSAKLNGPSLLTSGLTLASGLSTIFALCNLSLLKSTQKYEPAHPDKMPDNGSNAPAPTRT